ncbi:unnamed protein product [Rodentolepis nana]|uniref:Neuron navigator 2-like n=1 Tax=Rodentolepis nana TaxID=102285 RepID=A0A0R3TJB4_RODNA|nr:unnamed protein product [Rodentolepis nana]
MRNARIGVKQKFKQIEDSISSSLKSDKMSENNQRNHKKIATAQSSKNEHQFNGPDDGNQCKKIYKTGNFENLIKLLEDLKTTILESTKCGKSNLRESTIVDMEAVLKQIKSRLNESQMKAKLEGSEESSSSVVSMIKEVENSIKGLKKPIPSPKSLLSSLKPSPLKMNSLDVPRSDTKANKNIRCPINATNSSPSPKQSPSVKTSNAPKNQLKPNEEIAEAKTNGTGSRHSRHSIEGQRSTTPSFKYSLTKKDMVKPRTPQQLTLTRTAVEKPKIGSAPSKPSPETRNVDQATDKSQQKSQSSPPSENRKNVIESRIPVNKDTGRKLSTVLSKVGNSLRRQSGRSPLSRMNSPNREPIELCSRILKFCKETNPSSPGEVNPFQTYTPEGLYEKLNAMGPEGQEFLKNAQNYLDRSYHSDADGENIREEPDGGPSISRKLENGVSQENSIQKKSADQNNFENDSIKVLLQDLRTSVKNLELNCGVGKTNAVPEVGGLLRDGLLSAHPSNQMLPESEFCSQICKTTQDPCDNVNPEKYDGNAQSKVSPMSKISSFPQSQTMTNIRTTLNDICQNIGGMDIKDQSGPGIDVLNMLNDVRNTIKSMSTRQETQSPQPEVLSALKEIRETIYTVEERNQQAQERTNQEMMNILDCVRKSIRSVETSKNEKAALTNQQIVDSLKEMRQSVTNLEERSLTPEKILNPKVATLLSEIRSSIRFMESSRANQQSVADTSMMNALRDIKKSLVSIEDKRNSEVLKRPSVNMFVLGRKPENPEEAITSPYKCSAIQNSKTTPDWHHESRQHQEETNPVSSTVGTKITPAFEENYVKKVLEDIRQSMQQIAALKPPTCDGTELKQSIDEIKQEIRSLLGGQSESLPQYSERTSIRKLSENVTDIKTGMKSLIDNIPVIVDAARTDQIPSKSGIRACTKMKYPIDNEESFYQSEEDKTSPICRKVLDIMSEIKAESGANLPRFSNKDGGSNIYNQINSVDQLPSTFTFSFVGHQPPDINEPIVININGRNFKCSRI